MVTSRDLCEQSSPRWRSTTTFLSFSAATTSFKNTVFFVLDSISMTLAEGANIASGKPGKPAPDPRSITLVASVPGNNREAIKKDSPKCLVTISSGVRTAVRLIRAFHFNSRSRYIDVWTNCSWLNRANGSRRAAMAIGSTRPIENQDFRSCGRCLPPVKVHQAVLSRSFSRSDAGVRARFRLAAQAQIGDAPEQDVAPSTPWCGARYCQKR